MKKFEYKILKPEKEFIEQCEKEINAMGADGWELVTMTTHYLGLRDDDFYDNHYFIFKREIEG